MTGDGGQQINVVLDQLAQVLGLPAPPLSTPDPLAGTGSIISKLLMVLGAAANLGDPQDNLEAQEGHAERELKTADAAAKFPADEEESAAELTGVGAQGQGDMAQQMPQMISGIAGGIAGAMGGALGPLAQIPQQIAQGAQQAMQMGMGAADQFSGATELSDADLLGDSLGDELGGEFGDADGAGGGAGGGGSELGGTTPTAMLGPPPVPSASTSPASAPATPPPAPASPPSTTGRMGGMGMMPMMPPGAMAGAGGAGKDAKDKADTKRVAVPSVKNGAPVQGRFTTPPPPPTATKRVAGKPVATKRIVAHGEKPSNKADGADGDQRPQ